MKPMSNYNKCPRGLAHFYTVCMEIGNTSWACSSWIVLLVLVAAGMKVVGCGRRRENIEELATELNHLKGKVRQELLVKDCICSLIPPPLKTPLTTS